MDSWSLWPENSVSVAQGDIKFESQMKIFWKFLCRM
jgi:hypothetical protein